jgi:hypothetical protein
LRCGSGVGGGLSGAMLLGWADFGFGGSAVKFLGFGRAISCIGGAALGDLQSGWAVWKGFVNIGERFFGILTRRCWCGWKYRGIKEEARQFCNFGIFGYLRYVCNFCCVSFVCNRD